MLIVKNSYMVKPSDSTPNEIMSVSDLDQVKAITHAPIICFYRPTRESVQEEAIHILKDSLSKALVIFYPYAGRLQWIGSGRVEINCNSMGALLLEAETKLKIDDLGDFRPTPEITALFSSLDSDGTPLHEVPLLLIQLTKFACGGLSIGLKFSHVVGDGRNSFQFLAEWVKIARGEKSIDPPFFDRKMLQPRGHFAPLTVKYSQLTPPPLLIGQTDRQEMRNKPTTVIVLKLGREQVEKLKNMANKTSSSFGGFTRFEAVTAHIWRCACKARRHRSEQETGCYITVDIQRRLTPQLPKRYLGNAGVIVPAIATAGELLSMPVGHAAGRIRETIKSVTNEYVSSYLISSKNLSDVSGFRHYHIPGFSDGGFYGNPNIVMTSWIGLQQYPADFGWGKEIYIGPGSLGYDGRFLFIPSHDGDGSFFIPVRLQVEHADAFQKYFYEEIDHHNMRANL